MMAAALVPKGLHSAVGMCTSLFIICASCKRGVRLSEREASKSDRGKGLLGIGIQPAPVLETGLRSWFLNRDFLRR